MMSLLQETFDSMTFELMIAAYPLHPKRYNHNYH